MKKGSLILTSALTAALIALFVVSFNWPTYTKNGAIGSGLVPRLYLIVGIACGMLVVLISMFSKESKKVSTNILVFEFFVIAVVYAIAMNYIGFVFSTILGLAGILFLFEERDWKILVLVPLVFTVVVYCIFVKILYVPVPTSPLGVI